jgi:hypothetical protein
MPFTKGFKELKQSLKKEYLGEAVPKQYQKRYGKIYNDKDITNFAYAVAKSRDIKIDL